MSNDRPEGMVTMTRHHGSVSMEGSFLSSAADVRFKGQGLADISTIGCGLHHSACRFISRSGWRRGGSVGPRPDQTTRVQRSCVKSLCTIQLLPVTVSELRFEGLKTDTNRALSTCVSLENWGKSQPPGDRPGYPKQSHCFRPRTFITSS